MQTEAELLWHHTKQAAVSRLCETAQPQVLLLRCKELPNPHCGCPAWRIKQSWHARRGDRTCHQHR
jgi:hypothetical protein